jgi:hypothetical protein
MDKSIIFCIENIVLYFSQTKNTINSISFNDLILKKEQILKLFFYIFLWILFYFIIHNIKINHKKGKNFTLDTKNRIVSIVHASAVFLLSLYDYLYFHRDGCGNVNSEFQNFIMIFSISYFIYDTIVCLYFNISDIGMLFHHIFVILSMYSVLVFNNTSEEIIRAIIIGEISNPIMHMRKILYNMDKKETKLYYYSEYIFFFLYITARIIFATFNLIYTLYCMNNLLIVKIGGSWVVFQSYKYTFNMISILKNRKKEYLERKSKNVKLYWITENPEIYKLDYYIKSKSRKENYVP